MASRLRARHLRQAPRQLVLVAASALAVFGLTSGCGTDAVGIQDCRQIETARCDAALSCGIITDQNKCEIYYRDHCLHGLPGTEPQEATVAGCVSDINKLGACVKAGGRYAPLSDCGVETHDATLACDVVQYPERAYSCSFLTPTPPPPISEGGQGGGAGSEG